MGARNWERTYYKTKYNSIDRFNNLSELINFYNNLGIEIKTVFKVYEKVHELSKKEWKEKIKNGT